MKVDYSQAKIYKITNDFNTDIWIGSTCDTLVKEKLVYIKLMLLEILEKTVLFIILLGSMALIDSEFNLLKIFHVKTCINFDKDKVILLGS